MEKDFIDRRKIMDSIIIEYGLRSKSHFAQKIGVSQQVVNGWYQRNAFKAEKIAAAFPGINKSFILTGEGDVRDKENIVVNEELQESNHHHSVDMDSLLAQLDLQQKQIATQQDQINRLITIIERMQA